MIAAAVWSRSRMNGPAVVVVAATCGDNHSASFVAVVPVGALVMMPSAACDDQRSAAASAAAVPSAPAGSVAVPLGHGYGCRESQHQHDE
jgi:hypothetical protein